ncbi:hypothetical protein OA528_01600 [Gammaproteobacteria bacterium]|nr:hypothetical protein [Gammaproteobacteria bacterium]
MKKHSLILTTLLLAACGPSQEEKQQIATIACNVMAESTTMDGAMKIKEVNQAREQIGEPPFLAASDEIQESLKYEVCESLVINDPNYSDLLSQAKILAEEKFNNFIKGFWIYVLTDEYNYKEKDKSYALTAEFVNERIILTRYKGNEESQTIQKYNKIDDYRLEVSSSNQIGSYIILVNQEADTIMIENQKFNRAPSITMNDLQGKWLEESSETDTQNFWLTNYSGDDAYYQSLDIYHAKKEYSIGQLERCPRTITNGFIFEERCPTEEDPNPEPYIWLLTSFDRETMTMTQTLLGEFMSIFPEKRVSDDYVLPSPPEGYKDVSEK